MQVLKLGGGVLEASSLSRLGAMLCAEARELVLVHGAGRRPREALPAGHRGRRIADAAVATRVQRALDEVHREVVTALTAAALPVQAIALPAWAELRQGRLELARARPIRDAIAQRRVPLLHGGVVADGVRGHWIASSDDVVECVARGLPARGVVFATDVDGVLGADGAVLARVSRGDLAAVARRAADAADPTGAMTDKLGAALRLAEAGVPCWIVNGGMPARVAAALAGSGPDVGTRVVGGGGGP